MIEYTKIKGYNCWWLTKNGKSISNFDREEDVDEIIMEHLRLSEISKVVENDNNIWIDDQGNEWVNVDRVKSLLIWKL